MMAFGSVSATSYTNMNTNTIVTTIVTQFKMTQPRLSRRILGFHQELKKRFIEGGPGFMGIVLLCLILGLSNCN